MTVKPCGSFNSRFTFMWNLLTCMTSLSSQNRSYIPIQFIVVLTNYGVKCSISSSPPKIWIICSKHLKNMYVHRKSVICFSLYSLVLLYPPISLHSPCCQCDGAGSTQEKYSGSSCAGIRGCRNESGTSSGGNRTESVNGYSGGLSAA